jgi:hypothetical protein
MLSPTRSVAVAAMIDGRDVISGHQFVSAFLVLEIRSLKKKSP